MDFGSRLYISLAANERAKQIDGRWRMEYIFGLLSGLEMGQNVCSGLGAG